MTDVNYVRGWDDCLEAVSAAINDVEDIDVAKKKIQKVRDMIRQNKFEKIRVELGAFGLF